MYFFGYTELIEGSYIVIEIFQREFSITTVCPTIKTEIQFFKSADSKASTPFYTKGFPVFHG